MTRTQRETLWWVWAIGCIGAVFFALILPAFRHYVLPGLIAWAGA